MDKWFHPTSYYGCNYLSILGLKLKHVSKAGPIILKMIPNGNLSPIPVLPWDIMAWNRFPDFWSLMGVMHTFWCCLCWYLYQAVENTIEPPMIWYTMTRAWRNCHLMESRHYTELFTKKSHPPPPPPPPSWSLWKDKWSHPTLYNGCNYLSIKGLVECPRPQRLQDSKHIAINIEYDAQITMIS